MQELIDAGPVCGVLLDFDGTLVDSVKALVEVFHRFVETVCLEQSDFDMVKLNGASIAEIVSVIQSSCKLKVPERGMIDLYVSMIGEVYSTSVSPADGAIELLQWLRLNELKVGLVTSAPYLVVQAFLDSHEWADYFDVVVTGDDVERCKPSPDLYNMAVEKLAIPRSQLVAVEDSVNGVLAALAAQIRVIGLVTHSSNLSPYKCRADAFVSNLAELIGMLKENTSTRN